MKFKWDDGQEMNFKVGGMMCGISRGRKRPTSVEFTSEDIIILLRRIEDNKAQSWLLNLSKALIRNREVING